MFQVLFHIPFTEAWFPPYGFPVHSFGAMLFMIFVVLTMVWGPKRAEAIGLPSDKLMDMSIVMFITGIAGARLVYMIQYSDQFPDKSPIGLVTSFFQLNKGGIVLYGSIVGGFLGFLAFYRLILRPLNISGWQVADVVAPLLALGIAMGRIGCLLNGCCWGQAVCEECQPVPISARLGEFPLLPAHSRDQVCRPGLPNRDGEGRKERLPWVRGLQTSTGFSIPVETRVGVDPRTVVAVEPQSAAAKAGLQPGDLITQANGEPNRIRLMLIGSEAEIQAVSAGLPKVRFEFEEDSRQGGTETVFADFDTAEQYYQALEVASRLPQVRAYAFDTLWGQVRDWQDDRRGINSLALTVLRNGEEVELKFVPRTVPFYPTQVYETVSMLLLVLLLVAYQPFRRHDGQVMVLWMIGYAAHRFLNEAIRIEPVYQLGPVGVLTLSQWVSVGIFLAAILLELYLRYTMPRLPAGPKPLGYKPEPAA